MACGNDSLTLSGWRAKRHVDSWLINYLPKSTNSVEKLLSMSQRHPCHPRSSLRMSPRRGEWIIANGIRDDDLFAPMAVDAMQAVLTINGRGEKKYPVKAVNILKAHGKSARESFMVKGYALNCTVASQGKSFYGFNGIELIIQP